MRASPSSFDSAIPGRGERVRRARRPVAEGRPCRWDWGRALQLSFWLASASLVPVAAANAQTALETASRPQLTPKRTLSVGPAPGCAIPPAGPPAARRDNAESRRLAAQGQEAALEGDQARARDAFARAAALNPGDERLAYDLARAYEELADSNKAIAEFCRYLTLSAAGREAGDVRDRLERLVPASAQRQASEVQAAFRLGLALLDDRRYEAATRAFDDVVRGAPESAEGYFNRGLARAASNARGPALQDLEQYRVNAPTVDDRVEVGRAIEVLRRPVYSPGGAFVRSLVPGLGQFYAGHPVRGLLTLVGTAAGAGFALTVVTQTDTIPYVDPNGVPAPYPVTTRERSYFAAGAAAAAVFTVIGMIDAVVAANRSQRDATLVVRASRAASLRPLLGPRSAGVMGSLTLPTRRSSRATTP